MALFGFKKKKMAEANEAKLELERMEKERQAKLEKEEQEKLEKQRQEQLAKEQQEQFDLSMQAYNNKDIETANRIWLELASQGHAGAMNSIAVSYMKGEGIEKNIEKGIEWYKKAIEKGSPKAMTNLAYAYREGKGVEKNIEKALELYETAANLGLAKAQRILGRMYLYGEEVSEDYEKAYKYLKLAAEQEDMYGMYYFAEMHSTDQYGHNNPYVAYTNYEKAANMGDIDATSKLVACLTQGFGTKVDLQRAREITLSMLDKAPNAKNVLDYVDSLIKKENEELRRKAEENKKIAEDGTIILGDNLQTIPVQLLQSYPYKEHRYIFENNKIYFIRYSNYIGWGRKGFTITLKLEDYNTKEINDKSYKQGDSVVLILDIEKIIKPENEETINTEKTIEQNEPMIESITTEDGKMIMKDNLEQIQISKIDYEDYILLNNRIYKIIGAQTERINQRFLKYVVKLEDVETKETSIEKYNPTFKFDRIIDITKVK